MRSPTSRTVVDFAILENQPVEPGIVNEERSFADFVRANIPENYFNHAAEAELNS